ncbi:MAG: hypothetical protein MHM6MM_001098 [Cercozoa sp. M6MM]
MSTRPPLLNVPAAFLPKIEAQQQAKLKELFKALEYLAENDDDVLTARVSALFHSTLKHASITRDERAQLVRLLYRRVCSTHLCRTERELAKFVNMMTTLLPFYWRSQRRLPELSLDFRPLLRAVVYHLYVSRCTGVVGAASISLLQNMAGKLGEVVRCTRDFFSWNTPDELEKLLLSEPSLLPEEENTEVDWFDDPAVTQRVLPTLSLRDAQSIDRVALFLAFLNEKVPPAQWLPRVLEIIERLFVPCQLGQLATLVFECCANAALKQCRRADDSEFYDWRPVMPRLTHLFLHAHGARLRPGVDESLPGVALSSMLGNSIRLFVQNASECSTRSIAFAQFVAFAFGNHLRQVKPTEYDSYELTQEEVDSANDDACVDEFAQLLNSVAVLFYPEEASEHTGLTLGSLVSTVCRGIASRLGAELNGRLPTRLLPHVGTCEPTLCYRRLFDTLQRLLLQSVYSPQNDFARQSATALKALAMVCPRRILPALLPQLARDVCDVTQTQRAKSALMCLTNLASPLFDARYWTGGVSSLCDVLLSAVSAIDSNTLDRAQEAMALFSTVFACIPMSAGDTDTDTDGDDDTAADWASDLSDHMRLRINDDTVEAGHRVPQRVLLARMRLPSLAASQQPCYPTQDEMRLAWSQAKAESARFPTVIDAFLDKLLPLLENCADTQAESKGELDAVTNAGGTIRPWAQWCLSALMHSCTRDLFDRVQSRLLHWIRHLSLHTIRYLVSPLFVSLCDTRPERCLGMLHTMLSVAQTSGLQQTVLLAYVCKKMIPFLPEEIFRAQGEHAEVLPLVRDVAQRLVHRHETVVRQVGLELLASVSSALSQWRSRQPILFLDGSDGPAQRRPWRFWFRTQQRTDAWAPGSKADLGMLGDFDWDIDMMSLSHDVDTYVQRVDLHVRWFVPTEAHVRHAEQFVWQCFDTLRMFDRQKKESERQCTVRDVMQFVLSPPDSVARPSDDEITVAFDFLTQIMYTLDEVSGEMESLDVLRQQHESLLEHKTLPFEQKLRPLQKSRHCTQCELPQQPARLHNALRVNWSTVAPSARSEVPGYLAPLVLAGDLTLRQGMMRLGLLFLRRFGSSEMLLQDHLKKQQPGQEKALTQATPLAAALLLCLTLVEQSPDVWTDEEEPYDAFDEVDISCLNWHFDPCGQGGYYATAVRLAQRAQLRAWDMLVCGGGATYCGNDLATLVSYAAQCVTCPFDEVQTAAQQVLCSTELNSARYGLATSMTAWRCLPRAVEALPSDVDAARVAGAFALITLFRERPPADFATYCAFVMAILEGTSRFEASEAQHLLTSSLMITALPTPHTVWPIVTGVTPTQSKQAATVATTALGEYLLRVLERDTASKMHDEETETESKEDQHWKFAVLALVKLGNFLEAGDIEFAPVVLRALLLASTSDNMTLARIALRLVAMCGNMLHQLPCTRDLRRVTSLCDGSAVGWRVLAHTNTLPLRRLLRAPDTPTAVPRETAEISVENARILIDGIAENFEKVFEKTMPLDHEFLSGDAMSMGGFGDIQAMDAVTTLRGTTSLGRWRTTHRYLHMRHMWLVLGVLLLCHKVTQHDSSDSSDTETIGRLTRLVLRFLARRLRESKKDRNALRKEDRVALIEVFGAAARAAILLQDEALLTALFATNIDTLVGETVPENEATRNSIFWNFREHLVRSELIREMQTAIRFACTGVSLEACRHLWRPMLSEAVSFVAHGSKEQATDVLLVKLRLLGAFLKERHALTRMNDAVATDVLNSFESDKENVEGLLRSLHVHTSTSEEEHTKQWTRGLLLLLDRFDDAADGAFQRVRLQLSSIAFHAMLSLRAPRSHAVVLRDHLDQRVMVSLCERIREGTDHMRQLMQLTQPSESEVASAACTAERLTAVLDTVLALGSRSSLGDVATRALIRILPSTPHYKHVGA